MPSLDRAVNPRTVGVTGSVQGPGAVPVAGQGIYEESATPKYKVGTRMCLGDGRVFYYCKNGSDILRIATMVATGVSTSGVHSVFDTDMPTAAVAGDNVMYATSAQARNAGTFDDGFFIISNDSVPIHRNLMYKVRHNELCGLGGSMTCTLYDPVIAAHPTSGDSTVIKNPCAAVKGASLTEMTFLLGVTTIPVQANYYFWVQSYGPAAVGCGAKNVSPQRIIGPGAAGVSLVGLQSAASGVQHVANIMYRGGLPTSSAYHTANTYEMVFLTCMM